MGRPPLREDRCAVDGQTLDDREPDPGTTTDAGHVYGPFRNEDPLFEPVPDRMTVAVDVTATATSAESDSAPVRTSCAHCGEVVEGSLEDGREWFATHLAAAHPRVTVSPRPKPRPGLHRVEPRAPRENNGFSPSARQSMLRRRRSTARVYRGRTAETLSGCMTAAAPSVR